MSKLVLVQVDNEATLDDLLETLGNETGVRIKDHRSDDSSNDAVGKIVGIGEIVDEHIVLTEEPTTAKSMLDYMQGAGLVAVPLPKAPAPLLADTDALSVHDGVDK